MEKNGKNMALNREHGEPADYFPVGNDDGLAMRIYLRFAIFTGLREVALKDTSKVQTVLLLGRHDPKGRYVDVIAAVRVRVGDGQLDEDVWKAARRLGLERNPNLEVVGWFNSHPNAGLEMTAQEREIHNRFFPEKWQVFYVGDPLLNERRFYSWQAGKLAVAGGFRIYGKEEVVQQKMNDREQVRPDERQRERHLEHSVEKLQRLVQNPSIRNIDYVIIGIMVLLLGVTLLRPNPSAKVDPELKAQIEQISTNVADLTQKVNKLEGHQGASAAPDNALKLVGSVNTEVVGSKTGANVVDTTGGNAGVSGTITATKSQANGRKIDGVAVGSKVELHKIADGDTLYSICERYYGSATTDMAEELGKYNKLTPPNYDIFPGETIKIPAKESLSSASTVADGN